MVNLCSREGSCNSFDSFYVCCIQSILFLELMQLKLNLVADSLSGMLESAGKIEVMQ